jgi:hypothetical protein
MKKMRGGGKTDEDSHVFQYDRNTKWKMQASLKIKKEGIKAGKKTHKCQNTG